MHTLIVHEAFLNSSVLPKECLFTGRTDAVRQSPLFLRGNVPHPDNPKYKPFCSFPVMIPHAPGRLLWWRALNGLAYLQLALGILYAVLFGIHLILFLWTGRTDPQQSLPFFLDLAGFVIYFSLAFSLRWFCRWKMTGIGIQSSNSLIYLRFTPQMHPTAQRFQEAYNRFLTAHNVELTQLLSDDEEWQDSVGADWDQMRRADDKP